MRGAQDPPPPEPPGAGAAGPIRLMLVEDHRGFRRALRAVIGLEADLEVVVEVERGDEAGDAAGRTRPDVAIVDLDLSGADGVEAVQQIRRISPDTACLVLSAMQDHVQQARAVAAGAMIVLSKSAEIPQLLAAVRRAAAVGGTAAGASIVPVGRLDQAPLGQSR